MIWSDDFVWLHMPKCAGTKIESLFRRYFNDQFHINQDIVNPEIDPTISWHHSLAEREQADPSFVTGNRLVICSIRRLPSWLQSRYNYEVMRSPHLNHQADRLLLGRTLHLDGVEDHADKSIERYIPATLQTSSRLVFIRMEFFEEDFRRVFKPFVDVDRIPSADFAARENASPNSIPKHILERLWNSGEVYRNCPLWSDIERLAYGSILSAQQ